MENYQIGKDMMALNQMVVNLASAIQALRNDLQETRDALNALAKESGVDWLEKEKRLVRVKEK